MSTRSTAEKWLQNCCNNSKYGAAEHSQAPAEPTPVEPAPMEPVPMTVPAASAIMLSRAEATTLARNRDPNTFHKEAREVIQAVIAHGSAVEFNENGAAEHLDPPGHNVTGIPNWSTWKQYIAKHKDMSKIVGSDGIVRVTAEFFEGTRDANRDGQKRCDLIVYCSDGSFWRLHPGSKCRLDAIPKHITPEVFIQVLKSTAGNVWMPADFELPFTATQAAGIPQSDRLGKKEVWRWIQQLGAAEHEFDITNGYELKWWLWVANLEQSRSVVGAGITTAAIKTDGERYAEFNFGHTDGSICIATIKIKRNQQITEKVST